MSAHVVETGHAWSRRVRMAARLTGVAVVCACSVIFVWFVGLDWLWAIAVVLAIGSVGAVFATLKFDDAAAWDAPGRETPRGVRLSLPIMEASLAACDRLARTPFAKRIRALIINERDDRVARGTVVRQMRALLVAELRAHGVGPSHQTDEVVVALLGVDALIVFQPNDENPVTTAVIGRCLDAVERLASATPSSR